MMRSIWNNSFLNSLPMCGFIAQLVEQRTGNAEVTGSNPVEALIFFFRLLLSNCLNWKIYWDDHSSLSSTTAVQEWIISYTSHSFFTWLFLCHREVTKTLFQHGAVCVTIFLQFPSCFCTYILKTGPSYPYRLFHLLPFPTLRLRLQVIPLKVQILSLIPLIDSRYAAALVLFVREVQDHLLIQK